MSYIDDLKEEIVNWFDKPESHPKKQSMYQFTDAKSYYEQLLQLTTLMAYLDIRQEAVEVTVKEYDDKIEHCTEVVNALTGRVEANETAITTLTSTVEQLVLDVANKLDIDLATLSATGEAKIKELAETEEIKTELNDKVDKDEFIASQTEQNNILTELLYRSIDKERSLEYLWKKSKGILFDEETVNSLENTVSVPSGAMEYASLDMLGGSSRKFNQLFNARKTGYEQNGIVVTTNGDGIFTLNGVCAQTDWFRFALNSQVTRNGHKLYYCGFPADSRGSTDFSLRVELSSGYIADSDVGNGVIYQMRGIDYVETVYVRIPVGTNLSNFVVKPQVFDLTEMGIDYITTVEQFKELFPNDYYPYTEGSIIDAKVDELRSKGVNLWDEELARVEGGTKNGNSYSFVQITSIDKNRIFVDNANNDIKNGETYTISMVVKNESTNRLRVVSGYDISASAWTTIGLIEPNEIKKISRSFIADDTRWGHRMIIGSYDLQMSFTISEIQIEVGSVATHYNQYFEPIIKNIPQAIQNLDGYGIGINDTLYNSLEFTGDKVLFNKRVGSVDLGSLIWNIVNNPVSFWAELPLGTTNDDVNVICAKYETKNNASVFEESDKCVRGYGNLSYNFSRVAIRDSAYTDATSFKQAMQGVMLYYELAEPQVIDATEYFTEDFNFLQTEANGSIEFHYPSKDDGYELKTPNTITYMVDVNEVA